MEQTIVLVLFFFFLFVLIYRCATGRPAMPKNDDQVQEEPAVRKEEEPLVFPKIYLPPARSSRRRAYGAGAAVTGAALMGSWHSDFSSSPFLGEDIEMEDNAFPVSHDFPDCSISTGGFVDMVHGGIDPTGQGGMAGDFNPGHEDSFTHNDLFDIDFGSSDFGTTDFSTDFGGIRDSIGCDSFGTDFGSCGIGFDA